MADISAITGYFFTVFFCHIEIALNLGKSIVFALGKIDGIIVLKDETGLKESFLLPPRHKFVLGIKPIGREDFLLLRRDLPI